MSSKNPDPSGSEARDDMSVPAFIPPEVQRQARREGRRDRRAIFTELRFAMQSHGMLEGAPRLFISQDYATNRRQQLLSLPIGKSLVNPDVMLAINTRGPHPEPSLCDVERLEMSAYKVSFSASRVVSKPVTTSDKSKHDRAWPIHENFGPYLVSYEDGAIVEMSFWNSAQDLPLPHRTLPRVSAETSQELRIAQEVIGILGRIQPDDQRLFTLIPPGIKAG